MADAAPVEAPKVEPVPIVPGSMKDLYTFVPAAMVPADFRELSKTWPTWESATHTPAIVDDKVKFKYDGDYGSERVLVASGKATIIPDDGSPPVTISKGDAVYLHYGFSCTWHILEPMVQNYGYFDKDGVEIAENELTCDVCGDDCFEESYLFNDEIDICPRCFRSDAKGAQEYEGSEYQREGKAAKAPPPKRSPGKDLVASASKKAKAVSGDYNPAAEDEDDDDDDDSGEDEEKPKKKKATPKAAKAAKPEAVPAAASGEAAAVPVPAAVPAAVPVPVPVPMPVPVPVPVTMPAELPVPAPVPVPVPAETPKAEEPMVEAAAPPAEPSA